MILQNISLKPYNSFGIEVKAAEFAVFTSINMFEEICQQSVQHKKLIIGGGSNLLFTDNYEGLILKNEIDCVELIEETQNDVVLKVGAGVNWHKFVEYCIANNYCGVENLSLIPGTVGAAPIQNIGAYGVEVKQVIEKVYCWHIDHKTNIVLTNAECRFAYRNSIFKQELKDKVVICFVEFRLSKKPVFNTAYGAIQSELQNMKVDQLSIAAISKAVINIRSSKLPNPAQLGNAGSFFKNPEIPAEQYQQLLTQVINMPSYKVNEELVKIPAAWLIEQCGWKGYRKNDAGCHSLQPLVLVNYGNATGTEIYELSQQIIDSVKTKFDISLEREVNII